MMRVTTPAIFSYDNMVQMFQEKMAGVVTLSGHLLLEHLDHVVIGAWAVDLTQQTVELALGHEDANIVEGTTEVIFVNDTILVDVHHLEAVLVHVELLLGEASLILSLAHGGGADVPEYGRRL